MGDAGTEVDIELLK
jgi:hypothetical protein